MKLALVGPLAGSTVEGLDATTAVGTPAGVTDPRDPPAGPVPSPAGDRGHP